MLSTDDLEYKWDFVASPVPRWRYRQRLSSLYGRICRQPQFSELITLGPKTDWAVYFAYLPDGRLTAAHRFTLGRLRDMNLNVFVVCAADEVSDVPDELRRYSDALYWKQLRGYDFSAYTLALNVISRKSPHSRVFFLNDSVFGPFRELREKIFDAPWDLTGFTASSQIENHIQSYAFSIADVTAQRVARLRPVLFPFVSLNHADAVILCQETRLARVASRSMSVGSYWYADAEKVIDPTLARPFQLLEAGFPFLKKSLVGKHMKFEAADAARQFLAEHAHPLV